MPNAQTTGELKEITVTPAAEQFIRRMLRFGGVGAKVGFRLVVRSGGCSGLTSEFSVEAEPRAGDAVVPVAGLQLFLPLESRILLSGVTIDFADTRQATGLTFIAPKAGSCACASATSRVELGSL